MLGGAPHDFGRSVDPISTMGADYAHQIILAPLDFLTLLKFMKSQNEYMKLSHCPKFERNIREISALED